MRYKCPACDFPIFNRRVKRCESCGGDLPESLLYSGKEIEAIDAEFEKNRAQVAKLRKNMGQNDSSGGWSDGGGDWGGGDCGGDGGGCD